MTLFKKRGDSDYGALVDESTFVLDIQYAIERALDETGTTQAELAKRLRVSAARISQILSGDGTNLQARTIARIAHALGLKARFDFADPASGWSSADGRQRTKTFRFQEWVDTALRVLEENGQISGPILAPMSLGAAPSSLATNDNAAGPNEDKLVA